jgi:parallel beta-helix repeat protein
MSLTKASYSMITAAPINAADYGFSTTATAADNTTALQAAVNDAAGKTLLLPTGLFNVNQVNITAVSNTKIVGQSTVLVLGTAGNIFSINGTGVDPNVTITIENIIFNGNNKTNSNCLFVQNVHGVTVRDCQFYDTSGSGSHLVHLKFAWVTQMDNCYLQSSNANTTKPASLLRIQGPMQLANFIHTRFLSNTTGDGVWLEDTINNNFYGCDFEGCAYGVRLTASSGARTDANNFNGCDWEDNTIALAVGYTGSVDPVLGTNVDTCNFSGGVAFAGNTIYLDKSQRTNLHNISYGNGDIIQTANGVQTNYSFAYGGAPINGVTLTINNSAEFIPTQQQAANWLPIVRSTTPTTPNAYISQIGRLVRNGRTAYVSGSVYWNNWVTLTGDLQLGMPFTFRNTANLPQIIQIYAGGGGFTGTAGKTMLAVGVPNTSWATVYETNNNGTLTPFLPTASGVINFSGTFEVQDL